MHIQSSLESCYCRGHYNALGEAITVFYYPVSKESPPGLCSVSSILKLELMSPKMVSGTEGDLL
jgi:hypothetical protein